MNRKIIIRAKDFDKEICSFLTQVGADIPIDWNSNTLALVRNNPDRLQKTSFTFIVLSMSQL